MLPAVEEDNNDGNRVGRLKLKMDNKMYTLTIAGEEEERRSGGGEKGRKSKWGEEEEKALVFKTIMSRSLTVAL